MSSTIQNKYNVNGGNHRDVKYARVLQDVYQCIHICDL